MKWIELLRKDKYALLQSESDTQYAVVSDYDPQHCQKISSGRMERILLISRIILRRCYIFNQLMIALWKR